MAFTTATANKLINKLLRNTDFTHPATIHVSLHTGDPGDTGANEVVGGSYARQVSTFAIAANKVTSNAIDLEFLNMPTSTITHIGIWSAKTGGEFWWGGSLVAPKALQSGDILRIPTGDLDVTLT